MEKRAIYGNKLLPYLLLVPQMAVVLIFFYWPASQAVYQSFLLEDAFGLSSEFVGFENFVELFQDTSYAHAFGVTAAFSLLVAGLSLGIALLMAVMADGRFTVAGVYKTLLIWPYAVAPAIAGVLWLFMFQPSLGVVAQAIKRMGVDWNPLLNGDHAMALVVLARDLEADQLQFPVLPRRAAVDPALGDRGLGDRRRRPSTRRFWTIILPLLSPTVFFLLVVNVVYVFFDTFGIIDTVTGGGPAKATRDAGLQGVLRRPPGRQSRRFGGAVGDHDGDRHRR